MEKDLEQLKSLMCRSFCDGLGLSYVSNKLIRIEIPFYFPDGDPYQLYIASYSSESLVLTDLGHTMMHLSYENDIDKFTEGTRGKLFEQIQEEFGLIGTQGELLLETTENSIIRDIFKLSQAITKVWDLTFLNKEHARSTFYEDLRVVISNTLPHSRVIEHYKHPKIASSQYYPIDYYIKTKHKPLYLFGISGKDKARLTTITLEKLNSQKVEFESMIIFEDKASIPRGDLARLENIENSTVFSTNQFNRLEKELQRKIAA